MMVRVRGDWIRQVQWGAYSAVFHFHTVGGEGLDEEESGKGTENSQTCNQSSDNLPKTSI